MFLPKLGTQIVISWPKQSVLKLLPNIILGYENWDNKATGVSDGNGHEGEANRRFFRCRLFSTPRILLVPDRSLLWESRTMRIPFGRPLGLRLLLINMFCNSSGVLVPHQSGSMPLN